MMIVKTLMYTGIRVSELINIRLADIDFHYYQVRINNGKGGKDRIVPFPQSFKELLAMHADAMKKNMRSIYLNHRGRRSARIGEYERFCPNIRRKLALYKTYRRTSCDISC
ncbi:hypothetical protein PACILC2_15510 [Paenibacillus cisolokensis]|uniref:Tyr recombinase domain-containing protein n=1 Tax=Paenibacillus cisolokensis TaxID=1658519 RepID=A0ABQ4N439_9BACL|nr:hypothetical protein PACILC2_15510 [Paenibacillus cisolokensis]